VLPGQAFTFNELDGSWNGRVGQLHDGLPWKEMADSVLAKGGITERGNIAYSGGYTGRDYHQTPAEAIASFPSVHVDTDVFTVELMCKGTEILRAICHSNRQPMPYTNDPQRTDYFALELCRKFGLPCFTLHNGLEVPSQIFEYSYVAGQVIKPPHQNVEVFGTTVTQTQLILSHFDKKNCPIRTLTLVLYKHIWYPGLGCWLRITLILTFRKCCAEYMLRETNALDLLHNFGAFFQHEQVRHDFPIDRIPNPHHQAWNIPTRYNPSFDKHGGFISVFHTACSRVLQRFPHLVDAEFFVEITCPIVISNTAVGVYIILVGWARSGQIPNETGTGNITIEYIHECVTRYGGISKFQIPRFNPHVSSSLYGISITDIQQALRRGLLLVYNDPTIPYSRVMQEIQSAGFFRDLPAQHWLSTVCSLGAVPHFAHYLNHAELCEGTRTYTGITKAFKLPKATVNRCLAHHCRQYSCTLPQGEEGLCAFVKAVFPDPATGCLVFRPDRVQCRTISSGYDLSFPGQYHIKCLNGEAVLRTERSFQADGSYNDTTCMVQFMDLQFRPSDPWSNPSYALMEVKTSTNSVLSNARRRRRSRNTQPSLVRRPPPSSDSLFHGPSILPLQELHAAGSRRSTRGSLLFKSEDLVFANRENGTRVNIDGTLLCLGFGSSPNPRPPKRLRNYLKTKVSHTSPPSCDAVDVLTTPDLLTGFSGYMTWGGITRVHSDAPSLLREGYLGHTSHGEAVYHSQECARRALLLCCLVDFPYSKNNLHFSGVPHWIAPFLPALDRHGHVFIYVHSAAGLVGPRHTGNRPPVRVFGALGRRHGQLILQVPHHDLSDSISFQRHHWQFVHVCAAPWGASPHRSIRYAPTLLHKAFTKYFRGIPFAGTVVSFGSVDCNGVLQYVYHVRYEDGDEEDMAVGALIPLLSP
jgi:hypothetical protein